MAYITVIHPPAAEGKLAELYQRVRAPNGQVDNVLQIHSLRPHTMEGHMALYKAVLHHSGNRHAKMVSRISGCAGQHAQRLRLLRTPSQRGLEALAEVRDPVTTRRVLSSCNPQSLGRPSPRHKVLRFNTRAS